MLSDAASAPKNKKGEKMNKNSLHAIVFFLAVFITTSTTALAAPQTDMGEPSAPAVVMDVLVIRPLGIASIVLGSAVFVVALPFTIPAQGVGTAAKKLIVEPFKFTFTRPIGETRESTI